MLGRRWFLLFFLVAAGCGARSPLADPTGAGGRPANASAATGGAAPPGSSSGSGITFTTSSSSSSSSSGSGSGTGGGVVAMECAAPVVQTPVVTVADSGSADQPSLVPISSGANGSAAVLYTRVTNQSDARARIATLDAWSAWPPAPNGGPLVKDASGKNVSCTSLLAGADVTKGDTFEISCVEPGGGSTHFWTAHANGAVDDGDATTYAGSGLFIASSPSVSGTLFGVSAPATGFALDVSAMTGDETRNYFEVACATTPVAADATAAPNGWLVAVAGGTKPKIDGPDLGCAIDHPDAVADTELWFASAAFDDTHNVQLDDFAMIEAPATVTRVRMAAGEDGGCAAWAVSGGDAVTAAWITGGTLAPPFTLAADVGELVADDFGLAPLGTGALFALVERTETDDTIALVEVDASGNVLWKTPIDVAGTVEGPISILTSPARDAAVIAWPELLAGTATHVIRLARVDCVPAP